MISDTFSATERAWRLSQLLQHKSWIFRGDLGILADFFILVDRAGSAYCKEAQACSGKRPMVTLPLKEFSRNDSSE